MAYCTQTDIAKLIPNQELAELTTDSGSTPDATIITEAIAKADAEIDSYLGVKYSVPFTSPSTRVKSLSEDIALYYLYLRRSAVPEARVKSYDDAIAYLKDVAASVAVLPDDGTTTGGSQAPQLSSAASIFDRDNLTSW